MNGTNAPPAATVVLMAAPVKKPQSFCRRNRILIVILSLVAIGGIASAALLFSGVFTPKAAVSARFVVTDKRDESSSSRRLLDNSIRAADVNVNVEELSFAIDMILLCEEAVAEEYEHEGQTYIMYRPDHSTCVEIYNGEAERSSHGSDQCQASLDMDEHYVNFADQQDLDNNLQIDAALPKGHTYKFGEVSFLNKVKLKADVTVSNGDISQQIYTKTCGPDTCDSICDGADNMRDCCVGADNIRECQVGAITNTITGDAVGDTNEHGDIWTSTVFDAFESDYIGGVHIPEPNAYWRRCDKDMTTAPAESIRVTPKNGGDSMLFQFLNPLVIDDADDQYRVELAFTVNSVVTGKVKPMGGFDGGLGHKSFYDITDGFYNIGVAGLSLAPVAYKVADGTSIISVDYLIQVRNPTGGSLEQEFDLEVTLFYVRTAEDGFDKTNVMAASIGRRFGSDIASVQYEIPFFNMRVESITAGSTDNTVNFGENMGRGMVNRIQDFTLLDDVGDEGTANVLMSSHDSNENPPTYQAVTKLLAIHTSA